MTDRLDFSSKSYGVIVIENPTSANVEVPPYDYNWRQEAREKFQSGAEDNLWWFKYRKSLKSQGIIKEVKFVLTPSLLI